jgi:hypothetical protein
MIKRIFYADKKIRLADYVGISALPLIYEESFSTQRRHVKEVLSFAEYQRGH